MHKGETSTGFTTYKVMVVVVSNRKALKSLNRQE
jgi:hypothetical protein